ncbi:MAG: alpha/beta hydrolase [Rubrobacter sp.]|nr:alpha/beta hydrolase [Rubrobacter sp.]
MDEGQRGKNNLDDSAVLESITSQWWSFSCLIPLLTGALWLWLAARGGVPATLVGAVPGALLLGTGLSGLLWAVESRTFQFMVLASVLGVVLSLPAIFLMGPVAALVLGLGSAASFMAAGYLAMGQHRCPASVPAPDTGPNLAARAAVNELMMCGLILTSWPVAIGHVAVRVQREATDAYSLFEEKGWLSEPATYHQDPPPLDDPEIEKMEHKGREIECLSFDSLYEPHEDEPGRERWVSYRRNPTARAWILRHEGEQRPWLICVHGIRMGTLNKSIIRFQPEYLHEELGLNLIMPVLPMHGPRDTGGIISGERTLSGDVMDTLHTGAQAMWDFRRLVWWLRECEGAPAIGALGHSLGGYAVSLLASLETDLDCVVAGNPAVDPSHLFWSNALAVATHSLSAEGIREETYKALLRPVSPLALDPVVPHERRAIFAGVVDRVVPPVQAHSLWRHWGEPRIGWYQGAHQRFIRAQEGRKVLEETLRAANMLPSETAGTPS